MTITAVEAEALGCDHATGPNPRFGTPRHRGKCPAKGRTLGGAPRRHADGDEQEPTDEEIYGAGGDGTPPRPQARQADEAPITIPYPTLPLEEVRQFASEILWAPDYMLDALALFIAASHLLDVWHTVPRLLATAPEKRCGKTTLLDVVRLLSHNAWEATDVTGPALKSKFNEPEPPLILVDEASDIFGKSGLDGSKNPVARIARYAYRRTATVSVSAGRSTVDVPAFCFMALAGQKTAVPDDVRDRAVEFKLRRIPKSVTPERDPLDPETEGEAALLRSLLHSYTRAMLAPEIEKLQRRFTPPHPAFRDRLRQIWTPLYLIAKAADIVDRQRYEQACRIAEQNGDDQPDPPACDWAQRALTAFKAMALDASDLPSLTAPQAMLRDTATYIRNLVPAPDFVVASDIRDWLQQRSGEQLWSVLTDRKLATTMVDALGPNEVRARPDDPARKARGWYAKAVIAKWDALERALTPPVVSEPEDDESSLFDDVIDGGEG